VVTVFLRCVSKDNANALQMLKVNLAIHTAIYRSSFQAMTSSIALRLHMVTMSRDRSPCSLLTSPLRPHWPTYRLTSPEPPAQFNLNVRLRFDSASRALQDLLAPILTFKPVLPRLYIPFTTLFRVYETYSFASRNHTSLQVNNSDLNTR
jgi:hypothetical protein